MSLTNLILLSHAQHAVNNVDIIYVHTALHIIFKCYVNVTSFLINYLEADGKKMKTSEVYTHTRH